MAHPKTRGFRDQLQNYVRDAKIQHVRWVKRVAAAAHRAAYQHTPIDTSRAMSGWVATLDKPFMGEPDYTAGSKGSTFAEAVQINEGNIAEIAKSYAFGKSIYIRNNVHYIETLEGGSSRQAPGGMMKFALDAADREMS
jgi:hypothetical protein